MTPEEYPDNIVWDQEIADYPTRLKKGDVIGQLTVVKLLGVNRDHPKTKILYECVCSCGNRTIKEEYTLKAVLNGTRNTISCGCFKTANIVAAAKDPNRPIYRKHKYPADDPAMKYLYWIRARVHRPTHPKYERYGGRGITLCPEWENLEDGPDNFCDWMYNIAGYTKDMGPEVSIDRINTDGPYSPENCHLSLNKGQSNNKPSQNVIYDWYGHKYTQSDLAWQFGANRDRVGEKIKEGKTLHEALLAPKFKSRTERKEFIEKNGNGLVITPRAFVTMPFRFVDHSEIDQRCMWRPNSIENKQTCPSQESYIHTLNVLADQIRMELKDQGTLVQPFRFTNSGSTDFLLYGRYQ